MKKLFVGAVAAVLFGVAAAVFAPQLGASVGDERGGGGFTIASSPGATVPESKFVATDPCRLVDTRAATVAAHDRFGSGETQHYVVKGTGAAFAEQGGKSGGCGIPDLGAITAVAVNITGVESTGDGFLRAWPFGSAAPTATVLNFSTALNATNGTQISICDPDDPPSGGCTDDLSVRVFNEEVDVVIDVTGYFIEPYFVHANGNGSIQLESNVDSVTRLSTGRYAVEFGNGDSPNLSACAIFGQGEGGDQVDIWLSDIDSTTGTVTVDTESPDAADVQVDEAFYLTVVC